VALHNPDLSTSLPTMLRTLAKSALACALGATMCAATSENAKAVADKDTPRLRDLTLSKFIYMKKEFNLSQLQFHLPPATSLFRAHEPDKFGDDLSGIRQGIVDCNKTQKPVEGIEEGAFGFGIRGIVPVYHDNAHVGCVEVGISVNDELIKSLKASYGFEISIVVRDKDAVKYLARTHSLESPSQMYPWLDKMMKSLDSRYKQVEKNGKTLLTLYSPLKDYKGETVAVLALPRDITLALAAFRKDAVKMALGGLGLLFCLLALFYFVYDTRINRPLKKIIEKINQMVAGDFTTEITDDMPQPDFSPVKEGENKRCWETLGSFSIIDIQCPKLLNNTYKDCRNCTEVFKKVRLGEFQELSSYFNALAFTLRKLINDIKLNSDTVLQASFDLSQVALDTEVGVQKAADNSDKVAREAEDMSSGMNSVAAASEETSTNIASVAESARTMGEQILRIAGKTEKAKQISLKAVDQTKNASDRVSLLKSAAGDISKVTEVITDISAQTNLLALNATIEAARAGSAGKGFAVVAAEIKELANQTLNATHEIKAKVDAIQNSTDDTAAGIMEISGIMDNVNDIVVSVTQDMDEQSTATERIIINMSEAAQGLGEVNGTVAQSSSSASKIAVDIGEISRISIEMRHSSEKITEKAKDLAGMAKSAYELVSKFKA